MIKKVILGISLFTVSGIFAQQGTSSPYSFYGMGDQKYKGTNEIKAMGGLAVYRDSIHINTLNPASYADLQNTTMALGLSNTWTNISSQNAKESLTRSSFDYFALAFPAGKMGVSVGIMPSTFVGYKISKTDIEDGRTIGKQYDGGGGLNKTYVGIGYKITPNFSVGVEAAYNFGDTENNTTKFITDDGAGLPINRGTKQMILNDYSGFTYNTAVNYSLKLENRKMFNATVTYSPQTKLNNKQTQNLATVIFNPTGNVNIVDSEENPVIKNKIIQPQKYSIGAGYGESHKWYLGAEYTGSQTSKLNQVYEGYKEASYEDGHKFAVGGYYTPKYNSFTSYFQKITYRFGLNYEKTGLMIANHSVNDASVNVGIGLPVSFTRDQSNINIGLQYGQRGTTSNGLIKENYFNLSVGFSFNDRWFQKRKFD